MNPSPAEITSPDYWQKMPRDIIAARVWAQSSYHYNNIERLIADYSRLAGELARVEKERDATRAVVAAYLEWVNSECASELDGATATHAKLVFGPSMKSYPTPTLPAKEQR